MYANIILRVASAAQQRFTNRSGVFAKEDIPFYYQQMQAELNLFLPVVERARAFTQDNRGDFDMGKYQEGFDNCYTVAATQQNKFKRKKLIFTTPEFRYVLFESEHVGEIIHMIFHLLELDGFELYTINQNQALVKTEYDNMVDYLCDFPFYHRDAAVNIIEEVNGIAHDDYEVIDFANFHILKRFMLINMLHDNPSLNVSGENHYLACLENISHFISTAPTLPLCHIEDMEASDIAGFASELVRIPLLYILLDTSILETSEKYNEFYRIFAANQVKILLEVECKKLSKDLQPTLHQWIEKFDVIGVNDFVASMSPNDVYEFIDLSKLEFVDCEVGMDLAKDQFGKFNTSSFIYSNLKYLRIRTGCLREFTAKLIEKAFPALEKVHLVYDFENDDSEDTQIDMVFSRDIELTVVFKSQHEKINRTKQGQVAKQVAKVIDSLQNCNARINLVLPCDNHEWSSSEFLECEPMQHKDHKIILLTRFYSPYENNVELHQHPHNSFVDKAVMVMNDANGIFLNEAYIDHKSFQDKSFIYFHAGRLKLLKCPDMIDHNIEGIEDYFYIDDHDEFKAFVDYALQYALCDQYNVDYFYKSKKSDNKFKSPSTIDLNFKTPTPRVIEYYTPIAPAKKIPANYYVDSIIDEVIINHDNTLQFHTKHKQPTVTALERLPGIAALPEGFEAHIGAIEISSTKWIELKTLATNMMLLSCEYEEYFDFKEVSYGDLVTYEIKAKSSDLVGRIIHYKVSIPPTILRRVNFADMTYADLQSILSSSNYSDSQKAYSIITYCTFKQTSPSAADLQRYNKKVATLNDIRDAMEARVGSCRHRTHFALVLAHFYGIPGLVIKANPVHQYIAYQGVNYCLGGWTNSSQHNYVPTNLAETASEVLSQEQLEHLNQTLNKRPTDAEEMQPSHRAALPSTEIYQHEEQVGNDIIEIQNLFTLPIFRYLDAEESHEWFDRFFSVGMNKRVVILNDDIELNAFIRLIYAYSADRYRNIDVAYNDEFYRLDKRPYRFVEGRRVRTEGLLSQFFSKKAHKPILFVNCTENRPDEIINMQSVYDAHPALFGEVLPTTVEPILILRKSQVKNDPSFGTRADCYVFNLPITKHNQQNESDQYVINLQGAKNWRSKLYGKMLPMGNSFHYEEGELRAFLQSSTSTLCIQDAAPETQSEIEFTLLQAKSRGCLLLNGEVIELPKDFDFYFVEQPDLSQVIFTDQPIPSDADCYDINNHNYHYFLFGYDYTAGCRPVPGVVERHANSTLHLRVRDTIEQSILKSLNALAKQVNCQMLMYRDNTQCESAWFSALKTHEPHALAANLYENAEKQKCTVTLPISSDITVSQLLYKITPDDNDQLLLKACGLFTLLTNPEIDHIIIYGEFNLALVNQLSDLFSADPKFWWTDKRHLLRDYRTKLTFVASNFYHFPAQPCTVEHRKSINASQQLIPESNKANEELDNDQNLSSSGYLSSFRKQLALALDSTIFTTISADAYELKQRLLPHFFAAKSFLNTYYVMYDGMDALSDWLTSHEKCPVLYLENPTDNDLVILRGLENPSAPLVFFAGDIYDNLQNHRVLIHQPTPSALPYVNSQQNVCLGELPADYLYDQVALPLNLSFRLSSPFFESIVCDAIDCYLVYKTQYPEKMTAQVFEKVLTQALAEIHFMQCPSPHLVSEIIAEKLHAIINYNHFNEQQHELTEPVELSSYKLLPSRYPVINAVLNLMRIRERSMACHQFMLNGLLLEGLSGIGKSEVAIVCLQALGFHQAECHVAVSNSSEKQHYYHINSSDLETILSILDTAAIEGVPVIFDELNLYAHLMIRELDLLLRGKNLRGEPVAPGFVLIGTQNPTSFANRHALPEMLTAYFNHLYVPEYTLDELTQICIHIGMDAINANKYAKAYVLAVQEHHKQSDTFRPTPRKLFAQAHLFVKNQQHELTSQAAKRVKQTDSGQRAKRHRRQTRFFSPTSHSQRDVSPKRKIAQEGSRYTSKRV